MAEDGDELPGFLRRLKETRTAAEIARAAGIRDYHSKDEPMVRIAPNSAAMAARSGSVSLSTIAQTGTLLPGPNLDLQAKIDAGLTDKTGGEKTGGPGLARMRARLGAAAGEELRQQTLTEQTAARARAEKETHKPAAAAPAQPQESSVNAKTKTKTTANRKTRRAAASPKTSRRPTEKTAKTNARKPAGAAKSKSQIVEDMLLAEGGTTREALTKATGWPHVNLKVAAERAGKKLVEKDGKVWLEAK